MSLRVSYFKLVDFFLLDAKWYLMINKDVAASGLKAHYHFFYYGWREGRLSHKTTKVDLKHLTLMCGGMKQMVLKDYLRIFLLLIKVFIKAVKIQC